MICEKFSSPITPVSFIAKPILLAEKVRDEKGIILLGAPDRRVREPGTSPSRRRTGPNKSLRRLGLEEAGRGSPESRGFNAGLPNEAGPVAERWHALARHLPSLPPDAAPMDVDLGRDRVILARGEDSVPLGLPMSLSHPPHAGRRGKSLHRRLLLSYSLRSQ